MSKCICIILARGGSKGIKNKNIISLNGSPLIKYTIESAISSKVFDKVVVSTDSEIIKKVAESCGAEVPFLRPSCLAKDDTLSRDAVLHAVKALESLHKETYDYIFELQCTSPIRNKSHIIDIYNMLISSKDEVDSIVSVKKLNHYHPEKIKFIESGILKSRFKEYKEDVVRRRQDMDDLYIRNGSIFAMKRKCIVDKFSRKGDVCLPYVMSEKYSINIDTHVDLKLAELYLKDV